MCSAVFTAPCKIALLQCYALQVAENTALLKEFRDNIISILGRMDAMGGVMRQMPVLPVRGPGSHDFTFPQHQHCCGLLTYKLQLKDRT